MNVYKISLPTIFSFLVYMAIIFSSSGVKLIPKVHGNFSTNNAKKKHIFSHFCQCLNVITVFIVLCSGIIKTTLHIVIIYRIKLFYSFLTFVLRYMIDSVIHKYIIMVFTNPYQYQPTTCMVIEIFTLT